MPSPARKRGSRATAGALARVPARVGTTGSEEEIREGSMSDLSGPPFRADHVGSLLRPAELLRARAEHQAGRISAEELRRVEDAAIRDAARAARDRARSGDRRRVSPRLVAYGFPVPDRRSREDRPEAAHPVQERVRPGRGGARRVSHRRQADPRQHDLCRGFRLSEIGRARRDGGEIDDPVALDAALPRRPGGDRRGRLPDMDAFWHDLAEVYRQEIAGLAAQGCTYCSSTTPALPI